MQTTISDLLQDSGLDEWLLASILGEDSPGCQSEEDHPCSVEVTHRVRCLSCNMDGLVCRNRAAIVRARILLCSHLCAGCVRRGEPQNVGHVWKLATA